MFSRVPCSKLSIFARNMYRFCASSLAFAFKALTNLFLCSTWLRTLLLSWINQREHTAILDTHSKWTIFFWSNHPLEIYRLRFLIFSTIHLLLYCYIFAVRQIYNVNIIESGCFGIVFWNEKQHLLVIWHMFRA